MKKPMWLTWRSGKQSTVAKSENLKTVRRQTDQIVKQQNAQKEQLDSADQKEQLDSAEKKN